MAEADDGPLSTFSELSVSQRDVDRRDQNPGPTGPEQLGLPVLSAFVKESLDGIAVLDKDLRVLYMNEAGSEILGVPPDALVGETGLVAVPPRRREAVGQILREMQRGAGQGAATILRPNGEEREIEYTHVILDAGGEKVYAGIFRDISESERTHLREAAFAEIAASAAYAGSLDATLDGVAASVVRGTEMVACAVVLSEINAEPLQVRGTFNLPEDYPHRFSLALESGVDLPGVQAIRTGETVIVRRALEDPALDDPALGDINRGLSWAMLVCMPMVARGETVGALKCFFAEGHELDPGGMGFLGAVADQAAVAVENARLFEEAQGRLALQERNRLAQELHDSVSQTLFSLTLHTRAAQLAFEQRQSIGDDKLERHLGELGHLTQAALAEMKALIFELRPEALREEGLLAALRKQADRIVARDEITVEVNGPDVPIVLPAPMEEELYRWSQEALANAVNHAEASRIAIDLHVPEKDEHFLTVEVSDDGVGFDPSLSKPGHLGLTTMAARADRLRGTFEVRSAPGAGSTVLVKVPLETERDAPSPDEGPVSESLE
jgi:PAS domain S-box-containing protein